jgi:hypothetical protein
VAIDRTHSDHYELMVLVIGFFSCYQFMYSCLELFYIGILLNMFLENYLSMFGSSIYNIYIASVE